MTRLLLTLLALLTGLAAQVSPAQAAGSPAGEVEIGAVEQARDAARHAAHMVAAIAQRPAPGMAPRSGSASLRVSASPRVLTVLQGIDRARE